MIEVNERGFTPSLEKSTEKTRILTTFPNLNTSSNKDAGEGDEILSCLVCQPKLARTHSPSALYHQLLIKETGRKEEVEMNCIIPVVVSLVSFNGFLASESLAWYLVMTR